MTPADIIQNLFSLIAFLIAIFGILKSSDERKKLKTETLKLYNDMLNDSALRETNQAIKEKNLKEQIEKLEESVRALQKIIEEKDERIEKLQALSKKQESEINALRSELDNLKNNKK